ncbi:hypothetical protein Ahy_B02g058338 [Arachis hypogaea]|uniref:Uncharacterized protein n=1 Tax=Arachis hypogaea TaxID=3818 RepID=A0A445AEF0_ARAHY|nr:hypothetical protein Ahy_B02g058338 [Arachis hypogaea]
MLLNHFVQLKLIWDAYNNLMIRKICDHRAAKRLQQMMSNVRKGHDHLTLWICPSIKKELEAYFNNDEGFKHYHLMNVANRASPKSSKYTGESATLMKTKSRLSKSLDHEATLAETFKYTHTLKGNKQRFADERFAAHYEDYTQRLEAVTQQYQPSSGNDEADFETSVVDPNRVWRETAFKPYKNCRFGLGSFFASGSAPLRWRLPLPLPLPPALPIPKSCRLERGGAEADKGTSPASGAV